MATNSRLRRQAETQIKKLRGRLQRWLMADMAVMTGHVTPPPRGIDNGVDYAQPVLLPGYLRRQLSDTQLAEYLTEASARNTFRFQFDTPQRSAADLPIAPVTDDPLCEWDTSTREQVLSNCHAAYQRDPLAKAAVDYTKGFVVGEGFHISYRHPDVEQALEDFINSPDNPIREFEKEFVGDLQLDGEIICRFIDGAQGEVVLVPLRPWELTEIKTEPGFIRRRIEYCFTFQDENPHDNSAGSGAQSEDIPAEDILHVAINKSSYELRGRPELFVVLPWLRAYREWLEDRARQNYWRNALLWDVSVDATNPAAVAAVVNQWKTPPAPGSVYTHSSKIAVNAVSNNVGAEGAAEDGRQMKLSIGAGLRLPEYFFGDGSNANLASTTSQELPALTKFEDFQNIMIERVWRPVFKRVLQANIAAGMLPPEVTAEDSDGNIINNDNGEPERIKTEEAFEVSYAPLTSSDPVNIAQAITLDLKNGLVSKATAASRRDYDWQKEQRLMDVEDQEDMTAIARGMQPPPPTMRPAAMMPDEDELPPNVPDGEPDEAPDLDNEQERA